MAEILPCKLMIGAERVVITSTGFPAAERRALKFRVQQLGITYSGDLVAGNGGTTHLLCFRLLDAFGSPKYNCALAWGVRVLSYKWIYDSSIAGRLLPLGEYKTDSAVTDDRLLAADVLSAQHAEQKHQLQQQQHQQQQQYPQQQQQIFPGADHQTVQASLPCASIPSNLMQTRLPLSPLPSGFVRNSNLAQQPSDKDGGNNRPPPFDAHSANFLSHPQRPIALEFSSQDAFTFATPARRLNTAQPTVPSQEIPSPSFANLGAVPGAVAFNTGPFRGNDLMSTPANSRWDVQSSSIPAQNDPPASESERWRLQPHTQPKGCLAQCLTSEIPTAVQTSLDRLQLGRRSKAVGSLGPGSSDHPTTIDDIIPPTPGADTDSWQHGVIVPGTQFQDDNDEDMSTPQSLIQYLRSTLSSGVASTGNKHPTGECEHQHLHSSTAGSVLSFAMHTHRQESRGDLPLSEPGSPSLTFDRRAHSTAHTASPMAMSPLPCTSPSSPMQSSPFPCTDPHSPMAFSPAPFTSIVASSSAPSTFGIACSSAPCTSSLFPSVAAAISPQDSPASPMAVSPQPCTSPHTAYSNHTIDLVTPLPSADMPGEHVTVQARAAPCDTTGAVSQQHSNNMSWHAHSVSQYEVQRLQDSVPHQAQGGDPSLTRLQHGVDPLCTRLQRVMLDETSSQMHGSLQAPQQQCDSALVEKKWDPRNSCQDTATASKDTGVSAHNPHQQQPVKHEVGIAHHAYLNLPSSSSFSSSANTESRPVNAAAAPAYADSEAHRHAVTAVKLPQQHQQQGAQAPVSSTGRVAAAPVGAVATNRVGRRLVRNSAAPLEVFQQNDTQLTDQGPAGREVRQQQQLEDHEEDAGMRELEDDMSDCGESKDVCAKNARSMSVCAGTAHAEIRSVHGGGGYLRHGEYASFLAVGGHVVRGQQQLVTEGLRQDASAGENENMNSNQGVKSYRTRHASQLASDAHVLITSSRPPKHEPHAQQSSNSTSQASEVLGMGGHVTVRSRCGKETPCKPDASTPGSTLTPDVGDLRCMPSCRPDPAPQANKAPSTRGGENVYGSVAVKQEAGDPVRQAHEGSSLQKGEPGSGVSTSHKLAGTDRRLQNSGLISDAPLSQYPAQLGGDLKLNVGSGPCASLELSHLNQSGIGLQTNVLLPGVQMSQHLAHADRVLQSGAVVPSVLRKVSLSQLAQRPARQHQILLPEDQPGQSTLTSVLAKRLKAQQQSSTDCASAASSGNPHATVHHQVHPCTHFSNLRHSPFLPLQLPMQAVGMTPDSERKHAAPSLHHHHPGHVEALADLPTQPSLQRSITLQNANSLQAMHSPPTLHIVTTPPASHAVYSAAPVRGSSSIAALVARVTAASGSASSIKAPAAAPIKVKAERNSVTPEAMGQGSLTGPVNGAETIARVLGGRTAVLTPLDPTLGLAITPLNPGAGECLEEAGDSPCSTFDSRRHSPDHLQRTTDGDETEEEDDSASLDAQGAASLQGQAQHEGLSMYLRKMLLAARSKPGHGSGYTITIIKGLSRPTRSNTVREMHTGVSIKTVEFAEQIQIESMQLIINCRDRSRRTHCPIVILKDSISGDARAAVMEPYALYRLQSGEWWVEGYRFYTAADIQSLATASSTTLHLPCDFHRKHELLRDTDRQHARLADVIGELAVMRTKKLPSKWARGERPAFCRYVFDSTLKMVMTDQPATDFLIGA